MRGIHGHWVVTVLKRVTPTVARDIPLLSSPSSRNPPPVVENLAVELSLSVLTTITSRDIPLLSSPSSRKPPPVVENLAVELSLSVLTTITCFLRYRGSNVDRAYARRTL